jgi:hypothetical protein
VIGVCVHVVHVFQPPSRANFKGTKKSFCIGAGKDALDTHIHCSPDGYPTLTRRHGSFPARSAAEARGSGAPYIHSSFPPSGRVLRLARRAGRPPVATRWAVGLRTPPRRPGLPPRRPVGHGRRWGASRPRAGACHRFGTEDAYLRRPVPAPCTCLCASTNRRSRSGGESGGPRCGICITELLVAVRSRRRRATSWHLNNGNARTRSCRPASEASLGMRMIARQLNGQAATSRR